MFGALIILAVTVIIGLILWLTHKPGEPAATATGKEYGSTETAVEGEECCGLHAVCEKKITGLTEPLHFDDEELDRYAGREPHTYTSDEVEQFREVLYTLLPEDVYSWGASLTLRNISLPEQLRDEWIMLSQDQKQ